MLDLDLEPCIAPLWAPRGHLQTLIGYGLPSKTITEPFKKWTVPLADGDTLVGRYYPGESSTLVVIFHGLIGSVESAYMGRLAQICREQSHSVLLMNHRGCGEGAGLAKLPYHSGRGDDVSAVIAACRRSFPRQQVIALGFSLSANAVLSLVSGRRGEHLPDQAIAVNGPCDLKASAESLKSGFNRLYDLWFVSGCRRDLQWRQKRGLAPTHIRLSRWAHLNDVDELYTAPLAGFQSADDYYQKCSTALYLGQIKTPTFVLMSKDDPFIPWQPYLSAKGNPNVHLHLENTGGHMGYICQTKDRWGYKRWMDETLRQVLQQMTK